MLCSCHNRKIMFKLDIKNHWHICRSINFSAQYLKQIEYNQNKKNKKIREINITHINYCRRSNRNETLHNNTIRKTYFILCVCVCENLALLYRERSRARAHEQCILKKEILIIYMKKKRGKNCFGAPCLA